MTVPPLGSGCLDLPGTEEKKKYLDCYVFQTGSEVRLALLGERKNKERFVVLVEVMVAGLGPQPGPGAGRVRQGEHAGQGPDPHHGDGGGRVHLREPHQEAEDGGVQDL